MLVSHCLGVRKLPAAARALCALLIVFSTTLASAATIHGTVTDISGAGIAGAKIALFNKQSIISTAVSGAEGSYQIITGGSGRYFLVVSAPNFRQLQTPDFYAGQFNLIQRNLVLEPAWVRESIVVTATGTPTPQPQTSSSTTVLSPTDLAFRTSLVDALRQVAGASVVQTGQRGAQASLFIRGGNSDDDMVQLDGVDAGDLGGQFDFGTLSTTAVEHAEVYRGPDSNLYGADAASGVVSLTTPHGTTSFPSILFQGDVGNFNTSREQLELAGAHKKLDYLGAFSWMQTSNALPRDEYHIATASANLGWALTGTTQLRATAHYGVDGTGVPNAWDFYHVADDATEKDQDIYMSASLDNQTTPGFHNSFRYGLTRKREQYNLWQPSGQYISNYDGFGDSAWFGNTVTITGANGYSATGQAALDYSPAFSDQLANNRDHFVYQGDIQITPHLAVLAGFRYEDERGMENVPSYSTLDTTERNNYDYLGSVHGDFKDRFFYTLGGSLEHYSLFGTQTAPRAGFSVYALRPRTGIFSGTRILFNFGEGVREPALTDQFSSLYHFLVTNGFQSVAQQLNIGPLAAPTARTYEGGAEQTFLSSHIVFRTTYFHNEFGREIEDVGGRLLPNLIPGLSPAQQVELENALGYYYTDDYGLAVNTQAFRAQGIEATLEGGIGKSLFLRGGYTYLDAVVQRSFDSDNEAMAGGYAPTYNGIPIGAISPLVGARPFRRAPNTGFLSATYAAQKFTAVFTSAFASRSDDSTYLEYADANGGNSLLLPNRNLDFGYADLGLGGSYQIFNWMSIYAQGDNLLSNQHMAPIGYPSLPMNFRIGLRFDIGLKRQQ